MDMMRYERSVALRRIIPRQFRYQLTGAAPPTDFVRPGAELLGRLASPPWPLREPFGQARPP
jgi:hypothetical protein